MKAIELIKKDFLKFDKTATLSEVIGAFSRTKERAAVVFDKKKYLGITDKHLMLDTNLDPTKTKVQKIIKKVPILKGDEGHEEVARLLFTSDVLMLPVIKDNKVVGVVKSIYVVRQLKNIASLKNQKIKDMMKTNLIVLKEDAGIGKAIEMMHHKRVSRLPIVDNKGNLIGLTSFTDVMETFILSHIGTHHRGGHGPIGRKGLRTNQSYDAVEKGMGELPVRNLTSPMAIVSSPDDSLVKVIDSMDKNNINSVVLVKDKKPVGIVTLRDLLKLLIKGQTY